MPVRKPIGLDKFLNKVIQGDCLEVMKDIPSKSINMILCDLPYGTTCCKWDVIIPFEPLWEQYKRIIKDGGAIVLFGCEPFSSHLRLSNLSWYKYDWVWDKIRPTGFLNSKKQPMRSHEYIHVFYNRQCTYNPQKTQGHKRKVTFRRAHLQYEGYGHMNQNQYYDSTERYPRSIQEFSTDTQNSSLHPTQKPVELGRYLIRTYTHEGETVLDNCCGSGSFLVSSLMESRNFIGIEKEDKYVEISKERIKDAYDKKKAENKQRTSSE